MFFYNLVLRSKNRFFLKTGRFYCFSRKLGVLTFVFLLNKERNWNQMFCNILSMLPPKGDLKQVFCTNHAQKLPEIYVHAKFTQSRWKYIFSIWFSFSRFWICHPITPSRFDLGGPSIAVRVKVVIRFYKSREITFVYHFQQMLQSFNVCNRNFSLKSEMIFPPRLS